MEKKSTRPSYIPIRVYVFCIYFSNFYYKAVTSMKYTHLTLDLRKKLELRYQLGCSMAAIARELGVSRSTICREVERNGDADSYDALIAHKRALKRKARPEGCLQPVRKCVSAPLVRLHLDEWKGLKDQERPSRFFKAEDLSLRMASDARNLFSGSLLLCRKPLDMFEKFQRQYYLQQRRAERNHSMENYRRTDRYWKFFIRAPYNRIGYMARAYMKYARKDEKFYILLPTPQDDYGSTGHNDHFRSNKKPSITTSKIKADSYKATGTHLLVQNRKAMNFKQQTDELAVIKRLRKSGERKPPD